MHGIQETMKKSRLMPAQPRDPMSAKLSPKLSATVSAKDAGKDRDSGAYLRRLGERVRMLRNQRGITRKALAAHARVSERYLAQLEAGLGNCSIVLLRRIARALSVPVTQLVQQAADPPLDLTLLSQFLERLPAPALAEARELLLRHFGEVSDDLRRRRIALIGLRGGGKSTLGALLAERLGVPFIELDREIERRSGATLSEIFEMFGQETFRRSEREALDDVLRRHPNFVIATSGSIVTEPGTLELLLSSCFTVWVRADPEEHMRRVMAQGDMRPMANSARAMEDLVSILKSREPLYAKAETALITTGKTPEQNLADLLRLVAVPDNRMTRKSA
jgi:XRE family aerobic/anaerobic benzoate catabolism transcriptional regulator